uniref:Immunoglobulin V-set domain-containing protein n=1 Tax=Sciurus vulgaris TaxID=55149 RepID=A0A8D2E0V0_SCIVU
MEPPSASPHRGHVPWQGLLLAASLLTFWNLPTTAQLAIEPVPFHADEGTDVLLLVHNVSHNVKGYTWYKGERGVDSHQIAIYLPATQGIIPGPAYSGRETIYPNGSLLFQKVALKDTGFYTLQTISSDLQAEEASGQFSQEKTLRIPVGTFASIGTGVLVGVALVAALGCFLLHTRTGRYQDSGPDSDFPLTLTSHSSGSSLSSCWPWAAGPVPTALSFPHTANLEHFL